MAQTPIVADPKIMIFEKLAAGETVDQILSAHPRLTDEGVRAAIAFAAEVL